MANEGSADVGTTPPASGSGEQIRLACGHCRTINTVPFGMAGKPAQCTRCGEFIIVPRTRVAPGVVIGDFILDEPLGKGGMSTVYRAHQVSLDRACAFKVLHAHVQNQGPGELLREARMAAKLKHPNIVQGYAVGDDDGVFYFAMEFVEGKTLKEYLEGKWKLAPDKALDIVRQMVQALEYAWLKQRLVHRDVKPDNIMLCEDGLAKLADLGLAKPAPDLNKTGERRVSGTPLYMCPEQFVGGKMDFRGDVYSLGVVLYQCLTGSLPFTGKSMAELASKHINEPPPDPLSFTPNLPPPVLHLLARMLAKDPSQRYADFSSLMQDIDVARASCPTAARSRLGIDGEVLMSTDTSETGEITPMLVTPAPNAARRDERLLKVLVAVVVLLVLVVLLVGVGVLAVLFSRQDAPPDRPARPPVVVAPPSGDDPPPADPGTPIVPAPPATAAVVTPVPPAASGARPEDLRLVAALPDPAGYDAGREWVRLANRGKVVFTLDGWKLRDQEGRLLELAGKLGPGDERQVPLPVGGIVLNNAGAILELLDPSAKVVGQWTYTAAQVSEDQPVTFP